jgi:hypothetical protein
LDVAWTPLTSPGGTWDVALFDAKLKESHVGQGDRRLWGYGRAGWRLALLGFRWLGACHPHRLARPRPQA